MLSAAAALHRLGGALTEVMNTDQTSDLTGLTDGRLEAPGTEQMMRKGDIETYSNIGGQVSRCVCVCVNIVLFNPLHLFDRYSNSMIFTI